MSDPTPTDKPVFPPHRRETFELSRERFDSVPRKRAVYILAYIVFVAALIVPKGLIAADFSLPEAILTASDIAAVLAFLVFVVNFFTTLRIMGYELWVVLGMTLISVLPMPGFLMVAYVDRRIATVWDAADPGGGYRQRPPMGKTK